MDLDDEDEEGSAGPSRLFSAGMDDPFEEAANLEQRFYASGYTAGHAHGALHGVFEGRALGQEKAWELWEEVGYVEGFAGFWAEVLGERADGAGNGSGSGSGSGSEQTQGCAEEQVRVGRGLTGREARALAHAKQLLALIGAFPTTNPTPVEARDHQGPQLKSGLRAGQHAVPGRSSSSHGSPSSSALNGGDSSTTPPAPEPEPEPDLPSLLSSIRARYRLLCTSLGARPRLVAAETGGERGGEDGAESSHSPARNAGDQAGMSVGEGVEGIGGPMKGVDTRLLRF